MTPKSQPHIRALVTFLAKADGGRREPPVDSPSYRPHLVVGNPKQRSQPVAPDSTMDGQSYLGVFLTGSGARLSFEVPHDLRLRLAYHPDVDYSALIPGATFTVREGPFIVGFGSVTAYEPPVVV
jgi:hypothetical protein